MTNQALPPGDDQRDTVIRLSTTVWGAYGTNGLNGDVKRHSQELGELYARDETMRADVDRRFAELVQRVDSKFDGLYKSISTLLVSIIVGFGGVIATLLVTLK
jgi:hypothetical protein